jgi:putative multicomponent Na+:H+ antiporter subunit B
LGAADVALTEALVGTMLAITLYAVAVRSSLTMRLGVLEDGGDKVPTTEEVERHFGELMDDLRRIFSKHYMRVEVVPYTDQQALHRALMEKEVHATCTRSHLSELEPQDPTVPESETPSYHTATRVQRLYDIIRTELSSPATHLTYINTPDSGEKH